MATTTDKEVPPDEIIDLMISKLQKIRDNLNTTDLGRHRFKIIRLSDAIDALYEEFSPKNDPASKSHNSMQFTLVERPKSRVFPPVVAENGSGGVTQESESKDKKHGLDNTEEGRKLKKPRKYKRRAGRRPRQDQLLLPETWVSKPIPVHEGVDLRLDDLTKHSELFRRFFASHPTDDDDAPEIDLYALMDSDYAKKHPGYQAIVDMDIETVFTAFRTWNAWLLRGKIEMGATREVRDNALKLARFLGTTKEFVDAVKAFKPAEKLLEKH